MLIMALPSSVYIWLLRSIIKGVMQWYPWLRLTVGDQIDPVNHVHVHNIL